VTLLVERMIPPLIVPPSWKSARACGRATLGDVQVGSPDGADFASTEAREDLAIEESPVLIRGGRGEPVAREDHLALSAVPNGRLRVEVGPLPSLDDELGENGFRRELTEAEIFEGLGTPADGDQLARDAATFDQRRQLEMRLRAESEASSVLRRKLADM
jgi:hypothetical protein